MTNWLWSLTIITAIAIGVNGRFQTQGRLDFLARWNGVDETFLNFCFHYDGQVSKIKDDAENGHRCKATVHMKYTDPVLSLDLCRRTFPFHIVEYQTEDKATKCFFDVYVTCDAGWVQIDHKCFQLQPYKANAYGAIKHCKNNTNRHEKENPDLAQITKSVYSRFWEVTMSIWDSWMRVPTFEQYELEKKAENTEGVAVLVMGAQNKYRGVGYERFATPPLTTMAEYMCQYTPVRTNAYYMHVMKQYAEIYPNFLLGPKGMFMTSSRYGLIQTKEDPRRWSVKHYHDACKRVAKVFGGADSTGAIFPSNELYDGQVLKGKQLVAPVVRDDGCYGRDFYGLTYGATRIDMFVERFKQKDNHMCNANSVIHTADGIVASPMGYQSYIGCSLIKQVITYDKCPESPEKWIEYTRKDGTIFCHLRIDKRGSWNEAQSICRGHGAHLSGFEDRDEFLIVRSLSHGGLLWVGARVDSNKQFHFVNGVSPNPTYAISITQHFVPDKVCYSYNHLEHIQCWEDPAEHTDIFDTICGRPAFRTIEVGH